MINSSSIGSTTTDTKSALPDARSALVQLASFCPSSSNVNGPAVATLVTHPQNALTRQIEWGPSNDESFILFKESYQVPFLDNTPGYLPLDRRCSQQIYGRGQPAKGACLCIPGFASNRNIFHLGGGVGKPGLSFAEHLAKASYDVFSVDLRGTAEAQALGAPQPTGFKDFIEIDIPSAIRFVKSLGPYNKVYLIGHSMGAALSCAVAGLYPEDVAGVVHLAGLYHYTLVGFSEIMEVYRAFCPGLVQSLMGTSAALATKGISLLTTGLATAISHATGKSSNETSNNTVVAKYQPESTAAAFVTYCKRQALPFRLGVSLMMKLRKFVPSRIEKAVMNAAYPSLWVPNSVEDPWGVMSTSVENPTLGIYFDITRTAIAYEMYNQWNQPIPSDTPLTPYLDRFESLTHLPVYFCYANADGVIRKRDTMAGYARSLSRWKEVVQYADEGADIAHGRTRASQGLLTYPQQQEKAMKGARRATATLPKNLLSRRDTILKGLEHSLRDAVETVMLGDDDHHIERRNAETACPTPSLPLEPESDYFALSVTVSSGDIISPSTQRKDSGIALYDSPLASPSVKEAFPRTPGPVPNHSRQLPQYVAHPEPTTHSYGHIDILAGTHADRVWDSVVGWLDKTSERERWWRVWRRYSAK
ncbi:hypothetical protein BC832DRAFT_592524 [Gaertneriomyces semiglobifer]|nr:hypothetical protein BC832DRAFT_592524 [Gaertneriomyces semiglobifer]